MTLFEVNPEWVRPGLVPLLLTLLLAIVCVFLYLSLRRHIRIARNNDPSRNSSLSERLPSEESP